MDLKQLMNQFRSIYGNEREKGTRFEEVIKKYLTIEPKYSSYIKKVWLWSQFPYRDAIGDTGIDLVAETFEGKFWAIQCKFYEENYSIRKADLDTFLATSSKSFLKENIRESYSYRLIVSTTDKYSKNAENVLQNQNPPVGRIGITDLLESRIDWDQFSLNNKILLKEKYSPKSYQQIAIDDVIKGFEKNDRGKLIMACGTGKTFTSLRCVEALLHGKGVVLFLVPSIALLNQTMTEWTEQSNYTYDAIVVCSDNKASKGENSIDLGIPSTTDLKRLCEWGKKMQDSDKNMHFIFSTYQSIERVSEFQDKTNINFDIIVCDEAHRTTGVTLSDDDESSFVKVHDNNFIQGNKRLYMTATPRIYGNNVKSRAKNVNAVLCSMDDESIFGSTFHNLTFSDAISKNLLTDYKVLILAVDEEYVKSELQELLTDENHELRLDDSIKIMGCWNGLSKKSIETKNETFKVDPLPMKRAVAFCNRIEDSKNFVKLFELIQKHIKNSDTNEAKKLVNIEVSHVDGSFNALEKKNKISWLKEVTSESTCRILSNARCLSEGIDVPALDAVIFLNPRSSMVDIIQSVGRVMRKSPGKKYGYIMLPVGIPSNEEPSDALNKNKDYKIIWSVLQALRAHDDRFNNTINKIELNKKKPERIGFVGVGKDKEEDSSEDKYKNQTNKVVQLSFNLERLGKWRDAIYAKMVKKVGSKRYWESWANEVAQIAQRHIDRINILLKKNDKIINNTFNDFVKGLRQNLNDSITVENAIEMLAEHMVTKPVFDALFEDYEFVKSNPVSQTMQKMMNILDRQALDKETETLNKFYKYVSETAKGIDNIEGKQRIMLELYEKFFKTALPKEVAKLGIVYTPIQCVDFIINSIEVLLNKEFNKSLSDKGVHIIDGFTGTGTFIFRLLQSGIIDKDKLLYKYSNEIHANEIILLAYYIAAINIEETFHDIMKSNKYIPFQGIVLTDTFQLYENWKESEFTKAIDEEILLQNSERAKKQRELPITVCFGNPPYSIGQKSANDDAQNLHYKNLDKNISNTYAKGSKANLKRGLYDPYIRAFKWASDRIASNGIIAFITNGKYINNTGMDMFRKCLVDEFNSIYVFNLRGNQRTNGEESKKEGGKIFGGGSREPIAITILVKKDSDKKNGFIYYHDIGNYLSKEEKLNIINDFHDISKIKWKKIKPDENNDWINVRNNVYEKYISLFPKDKKDKENQSFFIDCVVNPVSSRDAWMYNYNKKYLQSNIKITLDTYNEIASSTTKNFINDKTKISWSRGLKQKARKSLNIEYNPDSIKVSQYRPFCKQYVYFNKDLFEMPGRIGDLLKENNLFLCVSGPGGTKPFSCLMTKYLPDFQTLLNSHSCSRYWYEGFLDENLLYNTVNNKVIRHDNISDFILKKCKSKYNVDDITKDDIFFYVYGVLHSKDYRNKYKYDLIKSETRLLLVNKYEDFKLFSFYGKKLADLHVNYESIEPYREVSISAYKEDYSVKKMKFLKVKGKNNKSTIIYNDNITINNIPMKAYDYVVNGKSAIEWIMDRYQLKIDKNSGIVDDPNDWCNEVNDEKYILNLMLKIINVSIQTEEIIDYLPRMEFN